MVTHTDRQTELIREYCAKAEALLTKASDHQTALHVKQQICSRFERECESNLVVAAARLHMDSILKKRWRLEERDTTALMEDY
jgi:hypothetical protein